MKTYDLHITTEVESRVYLNAEEKGVAPSGADFCLPVGKGEQTLLLVSTKNDRRRCLIRHPMPAAASQLEVSKSHYKTVLAPSLDQLVSAPSAQELAEGVKDERGVYYSADGTQLLRCGNRRLKDYQVKAGCQVIRGGAFEKLKSFEQVVLPDGLTHIGERAFAECPVLERVTFPASVTHIADGAFACCGCLHDYDLPAELTYIGNAAFAFTGTLNLILPSKVAAVGYCAFRQCECLANVVLPASLQEIGEDAFGMSYNISRVAIPQGTRPHFEPLIPSYLHRVIEEI